MSVSKTELSHLELELIQSLEESLQQKILEALQQSSSRVANLEEKLRLAELENRYLRDLLRRERIAKYGPGSEKLADAQLALLELEPGLHQSGGRRGKPAPTPRANPAQAAPGCRASGPASVSGPLAAGGTDR